MKAHMIVIAASLDRKALMGPIDRVGHRLLRGLSEPVDSVEWMGLDGSNGSRSPPYLCIIGVSYSGAMLAMH